MPMREDCRHFESRTYSGGEVARFCVLDLAPEAPWRCPDNCPSYEPSLVEPDFVTGSLARPPVEPEPDEPPEAIAELLDDAEAIVDAAAPEALREVDVEKRPWWKRRRHRPADDQPGSR
jgi:hypothetical protein